MLNCKTCRFSVKAKTAPGQPIEIGREILECRFNPPAVHLLGMPEGGIAPMSFFPIVGPDCFCHCFEPIEPLQPPKLVK